MAVTDPTSAKEIALRQDRPALDVTAYEPRNLNQAIQMAQVLANSGLLGKVEPRPETVLFLMARGRELGFSTAQSIDAFHILDGKPSLTAQAQVALCSRRKDVCQYIRCVETTATTSTWATWRVGHPEETKFEYTLAEAHAMGLTSKDNWKKQPKVMLRWRAATGLIRMVYPDLVLGLYDPDEVDEVAVSEGRHAQDTSIRVIDSTEVTAVQERAAGTFATDDDPEDDEDAPAALASLATNPTPVPVPGVTREWQAGDPCPECATMRLRGKFQVAKFGPHEGELQCTGKKGQEWMNHPAPKPAGTVEPGDPCVECARQDPPWQTKTGRKVTFYHGKLGLTCNGWDAAKGVYAKHTAAEPPPNDAEEETKQPDPAVVVSLDRGHSVVSVTPARAPVTTPIPIDPVPVTL